MRICSPSCGFTPHAHGGGARYEHDLTVGLTALGDEVVTLNFPFRGAGRWPVAPLSMTSAILRAWRRGGFDLLRCHSPLYLGPACVLARGLGVRAPLVTHVHHWEPRWTALERWVLGQSDRLIVDSPFVRGQVLDVFARVGKTPPPIDVAWCGVPEPGPIMPAGPMGFNVEGRAVPFAVTVGPLIARKRPLALVEMWTQVPQAFLVWIGDGPLRRAAVLRAKALGIGHRVLFVGRQPEWSKDHILRSADLFVFMSTLEGCPLAVLEAMACGLPIVAARGGPLPDLIGDHAVPEAEMPERIASLLSQPRAAAAVGAFNRALWQTGHTPAHWLWAVRAAYSQAIVDAAVARVGQSPPSAPSPIPGPGRCPA